MEKLGAIILAAGKGKRMNSKTVNKVALLLGGKPMILYTVSLLENLKINPILVVVGFAKNSVIKLLNNKNIIFIEQKKRLGTGHAVLCTLKKLPEEVDDVLILQGDDSAFYSKEVINKLITIHFNSKSSLTFLTVEMENPSGLGRIIRDKNNKLVAIAEEKNATEEQKKIKEINLACYIFKTNFLKRFLKKVKKNKLTREYYLVDLIEMAVQNQEKIQIVKEQNLKWRGVNTKEELIEAEKLIRDYKQQYV